MKEVTEGWIVPRNIDSFVKYGTVDLYEEQDFPGLIKVRLTLETIEETP